VREGYATAVQILHDATGTHASVMSDGGFAVSEEGRPGCIAVLPPLARRIARAVLVAGGDESLRELYRLRRQHGVMMFWLGMGVGGFVTALAYRLLGGAS